MTIREYAHSQRYIKFVNNLLQLIAKYLQIYLKYLQKNLIYQKNLLSLCRESKKTLTTLNVGATR